MYGISLVVSHTVEKVLMIRAYSLVVPAKLSGGSPSHPNARIPCRLENNVSLLFGDSFEVFNVVISAESLPPFLPTRLVTIAALLRRYSPSPHPLLRLLSHVPALPSINQS
jgi:hypothetical protein